ncbi:calmodulin binding protein PICBP-like [Zingiber officinale]|nr:calmodulin binding protein PICBP-like [Zingiber officinale]
MITSSEGARCNPSPKLSNKHMARRRSVKWKKDIEMEVLRLINPRAPRFLPLEPDPADEMVDLRHQQRDERKSSETWMIDNALQKAVRKLTPARSKKVALLVEAFETVMSVPIHDFTLKSPTSDLGRPVLA